MTEVNLGASDGLETPAQLVAPVVWYMSIILY